MRSQRQTVRVASLRLGEIKGRRGEREMINQKPGMSRGVLPVVVSVVLALGLASCGTPPTAEQLRNADHGAPPGPGHQQVIKEWYAERLIDPTSPLYTFGTPVRGYTQENPIYGSKLEFGWIVCGTVNAKNRMGGYAGRETFFTLFKNDELRFIYTGSTAADACARAGA